MQQYESQHHNSQPVDRVIDLISSFGVIGFDSGHLTVEEDISIGVLIRKVKCHYHNSLRPGADSFSKK